jgi:hypothetical protein
MPAMGSTHERHTMKRSTLAPDATAWLTETFRRNADLYGGMRMDAGDGDGGGNAGADTDGGDTDDSQGAGDDGDKPLGPAGEKALKAQREANKAMKAQLDELQQGNKQFKDTLAAALGIKTDDGKDDQQADLLASVQEQIRGMQREAAVLKLANAHQITDEADLELLASAKDDEAMKRLAERLAPTADESKEEKGKRQPKPDRTQGGGSGGQADNSGVSHGRGLYQASRGKTS